MPISVAIVFCREPILNGLGFRLPSRARGRTAINFSIVIHRFAQICADFLVDVIPEMGFRSLMHESKREFCVSD